MRQQIDIFVIAHDVVFAIRRRRCGVFFPVAAAVGGGMVWPTFVVLLSFRYVLDCRQLYLLSSVYAAGFYDWADAKRGRRQWRRLRGVTGTARGTWV